MFPLSDTTPRRSFPFVTYLVIAANVAVFFLQMSAPSPEEFITQYAFVPARFDFLSPISYLPIFTSMFMHGGILHIVSNLWFLRIFGDNVEDAMGHVPFLLFYLFGGVAAALAQYVVMPGSTVPTIGASGAISAVAGAYFILYTRSRVKTLVFMFIFVTVTELPVWLFLGYWFVLQLFSGVGSFVSFDVNQGGVAWFAHIGGFVYGYFMGRRRKRELMYAPDAV